MQAFVKVSHSEQQPTTANIPFVWNDQGISVDDVARRVKALIRPLTLGKKCDVVAVRFDQGPQHEMYITVHGQVNCTGDIISDVLKSMTESGCIPDPTMVWKQCMDSPR